MADTGTPPQGPGLEARVARLESDVAHIRGDLADVKSTLNRLAPVIDEMRGFLNAKLPELATKAESADLRSETKTQLADFRSETKTQLADLRSETKTQLADLRSETKTQLADLRNETKAEFADIRRELAELRIDIVQRPTRRQAVFDIFAIVGLIGAVLTVASHFAQ